MASNPDDDASFERIINTPKRGIGDTSVKRMHAIARAQGKPVRVALGWINNVEYAGVWMGLENGYFKEEGLDVKTLPGGPNAPPPPVTVASGGAEIGYGNWLPYLDALARGNDFVLLAGTFPVSMGTYLENAFRQATGNPNFKVVGNAYCDAANNNSLRGLNKNIYALYRYDDKGLRMDIPVDFTVTQPNSLE